jgi:O-antigen ligase
MASGLIVATHLHALARRPWVVHVLAAAMIAVSVAALFFNVGGSLVETIGRDTTLTGRTELWKEVLTLNPSTLFGTGFENFWLPSRLDQMWRLYWWHPNEAHNGYIEVFINLGVVGLVMLGVVIATSYRKVFGAVSRNPEEGGLWLAYFVIGLVYNFTESAIRIMHPVWIFFLLAIMAAPAVPASESVSPLATYESDVFSEPEPRVEHVLCIESRQKDA